MNESNEFIGEDKSIPHPSNCVFIGKYAGADIIEGDRIVIIGDDIRSLDQKQTDVAFLGDKVAVGNYLFGEYIGLKDKIAGFYEPNPTLPQGE